MKILVIRLSSLGDIIMTTPIIRCLATQNIAESVDVVIHKKYAAALQYNPYVNHLWLWTPELSTTISDQINTRSYDIVIDLHNTQKSRNFSKALQFDCIRTDKMPLRKWLYLLASIDMLHGKHVIDRHFAAVQTLGVRKDGMGMQVFTAPNPPTVVQADIVISLAGSTLTKRIPAPLANDIIDHFSDYKIALVGGADVAYYQALIPPQPHIDYHFGEDLDTTIQLIKNCRVLLTGDTATMHIGAALQKPQVVVWGSTSPIFGFSPYYGNTNDQKHISIENHDLTCHPCSKIGKKKCPKGHMKCLTDISTKEVIDSINTFLQ